jgi:hypothetical protein
MAFTSKNSALLQISHSVLAAMQLICPQRMGYRFVTGWGMLKSVRGVGAAVLVLGLFGCSSLPDQSEMTGVDIVDIIQNVRCELKEAISAYPANAPINHMLIAYNFDFTSFEENVAAGGATFAIPMAHGVFKIGFDAGETKHREGERTINITEEIGNVRKLNCSHTARSDSLHYPVTGSVGIANVIQRYVSLHGEKGLKVGTFTDQLVYWLQLNANVRPSVSLIPVSKHNIDASAQIGATRKDQHKIFLSISEPSRKQQPLDIRITNWPDNLALQGGGPEGTPKSGLKSGRSGGSGSGGGGDNSKDNALRDLNYERSLKIQQDILDRLR